MKLFYLGSIINNNTFEEIVANSKYKPSAAPQQYEKLLLMGLENQENIELYIYSMPAIATYPGSNKIAWGFKSDTLTDGIKTTWIPCINIAILKQITMFIGTFYSLLRFMFSVISEQDKIVVVYGININTALPVYILSRIFRCATVAIIPDLPDYLFLNRKANRIKRIIWDCYINACNWIMRKFDGYVLLTLPMVEKIGFNNKPYVIIEGFSNPIDYKENQNDRKKAIMYAGALHMDMGIDLLLETFLQLDDESIELWIFGSGNYEKEIKQFSYEDSRIKYFGRVAHEIVLDYQKKAMLLVNLRNNKDDYTRYSFPSKTLEYMASGAPLLMTYMEGIPNEYYKYSFMLESRDPISLRNMIIRIMDMNSMERSQFGEDARLFVLKQKNPKIQCEKINNLLANLLKESEVN